MTMPMARRGEVQLIHRLSQHEVNLLLALMSGRTLHTSDLVALVWADPDLEPDYARDVLYGCLARLREKGLPVERIRNEHYRLAPYRAAGSKGGSRP